MNCQWYGWTDLDEEMNLSKTARSFLVLNVKLFTFFRGIAKVVSSHVNGATI
jgi:hypothetical protein